MSSTAQEHAAMSSTARPRWARILPELVPPSSPPLLSALSPLLGPPIATMGMTSAPSLSDLSAVDVPAPKQGPVFVFGSTLKTCAICLEDYRPGDRLRLLEGCGHVFHAACVDAWLDRRHEVPTRRHRHLPQVCPVCKAPVPSCSLPPASPQSPPPVTPPPGREESPDSLVPRTQDPLPRHEPSANIQLIDLSVHQSWIDWFQGLLKLYSASERPHQQLP